MTRRSAAILCKGDRPDTKRGRNCIPYTCLCGKRSRALTESGLELLLQFADEHGLPNESSAERRHDLGNSGPFFLFVERTEDREGLALVSAGSRTWATSPAPRTSRRGPLGGKLFTCVHLQPCRRAVRILQASQGFGPLCRQGPRPGLQTLSC
jgi:hypothetical protein